MGRVVNLQKPGPEATVKASPELRALAKLDAEVADAGRIIAELEQPERELAEARAALPGAEDRLKAALFEDVLGNGDAAALDASKAEVKRHRAIIAGRRDCSAELAEARTRHVDLCDRRLAAVADVVRVEGHRLGEVYHRASREALAAERGLEALGFWAMQARQPGLAIELGDQRLAAEMAHQRPAAAATLQGELQAYLDAVSAWVRALAAGAAAGPLPDPEQAAAATTPRPQPTGAPPANRAQYATDVVVPGAEVVAAAGSLEAKPDAAPAAPDRSYARPARGAAVAIQHPSFTPAWSDAR